MEVREQRVRFVVAALRREQSLSSPCREFDISRPTGRLWLERYRAGGVAAIAEQSRRPQHSPQKTAPELEQRVVELRLRYPDWGTRKLQVLLEQAGLRLPSQHHPPQRPRRGSIRKARGHGRWTVRAQWIFAGGDGELARHWLGSESTSSPWSNVF